MEDQLLENSKWAVKGPLCTKMKEALTQNSVGYFPLVLQFKISNTRTRNELLLQLRECNLHIKNLLPITFRKLLELILRKWYYVATWNG